jgi:mannose-6-phosphate isomerase-like protein (cupin superfamily)
MHRVIQSGELPPSPGGTVTFEGEPYGSGVSFFHVNNEPGKGPDLHKHPYSETWIVRSGRVRIIADGEEIEAGPGDIVVVSPETPHRFKNIGSGPLEIICIHASSRIIQEWVVEPAQESDLPHEIGRPARRALVGAGYVELKQLVEVSEADLIKLHGVGPKAIDRLRRALAANGLSFAGERQADNQL